MRCCCHPVATGWPSLDRITGWTGMAQIARALHVRVMSLPSLSSEKSSKSCYPVRKILIGSEYRYGVQPSGCTVPEPNWRGWDLSLEAAQRQCRLKPELH